MKQKWKDMKQRTNLFAEYICTDEQTARVQDLEEQDRDAESPDRPCSLCAQAQPARRVGVLAATEQPPAGQLPALQPSLPVTLSTLLPTTLLTHQVRYVCTVLNNYLWWSRTQHVERVLQSYANFLPTFKYLKRKKVSLLHVNFLLLRINLYHVDQNAVFFRERVFWCLLSICFLLKLFT